MEASTEVVTARAVDVSVAPLSVSAAVLVASFVVVAASEVVIAFVAAWNVVLAMCALVACAVTVVVADTDAVELATAEVVAALVDAEWREAVAVLPVVGFAVEAMLAARGNEG